MQTSILNNNSVSNAQQIGQSKQTEREILNALKAYGFSFDYSHFSGNPRWESPNGQFLVYWDSLAEIVEWAADIDGNLEEYVGLAYSLEGEQD